MRQRVVCHRVSPAVRPCHAACFSSPRARRCFAGGDDGAPPAATLGAHFALAPATARTSVQLSLGPAARRPEARQLLGLGFADARIAAARVTVIGANMVREVKVVPWNGQDALSVNLSVPVGNARLFVLEALDRDPAVILRPNATPSAGPRPADLLPEPAVLAVLRTVANVPASGGVNLALNYQTDAVGRVMEALHEGLAQGFAPLGIPAEGLTDDRRAELLAAMNQADFSTKLNTFVAQVTKYTPPDATHPAGTYAGVHPLYFNADHLVALLIKQGLTVLDQAPPMPLEAFRAVGELRIEVAEDAYGNGSVDPRALQVVLQTPFVALGEGGLAFADTARLAKPVPDARAWVYVLKDVPPGRWGIVASLEGKVLGTRLVRVKAGTNEAELTVDVPAGYDVPPGGGGSGGGGSGGGGAESVSITLAGRVFDEEGSPVSGAEVQVELDRLYEDFPAGWLGSSTSGRFTASATTSTDGAWSLPPFAKRSSNPTARVQASKPGWTQRTRGVELANTASPTIDFGAAAVASSSDAAAAGAFLSNRPEITWASNHPRAHPVWGSDSQTWHLEFSEPLSGPAIERLVRAARLMPANAAANLGTALPNWAGLLNSDVADGLGSLVAGDNGLLPGVQYGFKVGLFPNYRFNDSMGEDGRSLTLRLDTLQAPLLTSKDGPAAYQLMFISDGQPILDAEGKQLGTDHTGSLTSWPVAGRPILNLIQAEPGDTPLGDTPLGTTAASRWAATHASLRTTFLPTDTSRPRLEERVVTRPASAGQEDLWGIQLELHGVEPRYAGTSLAKTNLETLDNLENYTFAFGKAVGDLNYVRLTGNPVDVPLTPETESLDAALTAANAWGKEVRFVPTVALGADAVADLTSPAPTGALLWVRNEEYYWAGYHYRTLCVAGRPQFFQAAQDLKVRAVNLRNVPGNVITPAQADADVRRAAPLYWGN